MLPGYHPVFQALLGTLFTFGLTALGSSLVYILPANAAASQKWLDAMLGFAAGVMLAASYWSLLAPAIDAAEQDPRYGPDGRYAFVPAATGFATGAFSMLGAERILSFCKSFGKTTTSPMTCAKKNDDLIMPESASSSPDAMADQFGVGQDANKTRRVLLLVIAITIHNFPEGMAVGVGFGSVGHAESATFANAVNLAIGIGLQNFPEGLAVSMPLKRAGMSTFKAFLWGSLSGLVEPLGGVLGAAAVLVVQPLLPYALSFAAGAMVFVVVDDLIPEAASSGNQRLATIGTIWGFIVMMVMDVALG